MSGRRVLIVDDSPVFCRILASALRTIPEVEVVGVSHSGARALETIPSRSPDLVTLDVMMPDGDGLQTLRALRRAHPSLKVLMISSRTRRGAVETVESLQCGASDYLPKPGGSEGGAGGGGGLEVLARGLREKVEALLPLADVAPPPPLPPPSPRRRARPDRIDVVAIACSTGGPAALTELLPALPAWLGVPIVVVQHILPEFSAHLAKSLDRRAALAVAEARAGEALRAGRILVAPSGVHTVVSERDGVPVVEHRRGPPVHECRPAADVLLASLPAVFGPRILTVVLTGIGEDGAAGCALVRAAGGWTLVQRPEEAVAPGMPSAVVRAGQADEVLPLRDLARRIVDLCAGPRGGDA